MSMSGTVGVPLSFLSELWYPSAALSFPHATRVLAKASEGGCLPSFFIQPPLLSPPFFGELRLMWLQWNARNVKYVLNHHHPFAEF